jgi:hypothetical protein
MLSLDGAVTSLHTAARQLCDGGTHRHRYVTDWVADGE